MGRKTRANQACSTILALTLAVGICVPTIAWGEEPPSDAELVTATSGDNAALQAFESLVAALPDANAVSAENAQAAAAAVQDAQEAYGALGDSEKEQAAESYAKLEAVAAALQALNEPAPQVMSLENNGSDGAGVGASIGGNNYDTLQSAVTAAANGDTITLLADATVSATIDIDKSLTINLNGKKVSDGVTGARLFNVNAPNVEFTIDGTASGSAMTIPQDNTKAYGLINIAESGTGSVVTLNGGTYEGKTDSGSLLFKTPNSTEMSVTINLTDVNAVSNRLLGYSDIAKLDVSVTGGSFKSTSDKAEPIGPQENNVGGNAFALGSKVGNGTISFKDATVETFNGYGIEVSGPTATFENCTFEAMGGSLNATPNTTVAVSGNGTANIVSGSYTSSHYGIYAYSSGGTLNVQDGTISGETAAIRSDFDDKNYPDPKPTIVISGGAFKGAFMLCSESTASITGGTFDSDVTGFLDSDIYSQNAQDASENPGAVVPRTFDITYDLAGGALADGASNPATYTYFSDAITLANPSKEGYTFAGWTGGGIAGASTSVVIPVNSSGDRAYTATWTANEARIAFESNGGSNVDDIVGKTGEPVTGQLPTPSAREGFAFAGWYADAGFAKPVTALPATFPAGTTTYYAKWNVVPLPDAPGIQVDVPAIPDADAPHVTVDADTVKAAAQTVQNALEAIKSNNVPAGMKDEDAQRIFEKLAAAQPDDDVSAVVSLGAAMKDEGSIDEGEKRAINGVAEGEEEVALFFDLSVKMTVVVTGSDGADKGSEAAPLSTVEYPLLFEVHVDPALIQGKTVRIAYVHEGEAMSIEPESVDREGGIIRFYASAFSTYALLTSPTCAVSFESNGGSAVPTQTVAYGATASKPADPTRDGYVFAGWFSDRGCTLAYDFGQEVNAPLTLFAKWTATSASGGEDDVTPGAPTHQAKGKVTKASHLASTGDGSGTLLVPLAGASAFALIVLAAAAILVRRRSR